MPLHCSFSHRSILPSLKAVCIGALLTATPLLAANTYDRADAEGAQLVVKVSPAHLNELVAEYGLVVQGELHANSRNLYVVRGPAGMNAGQVQAMIGNDGRVVGMNTVEIAALQRAGDEQRVAASTAEAQEDLDRVGLMSGGACQNSFAVQEMWTGYGDQRMTEQIGLQSAHQIVAPLGCGSGATVAIIDTGIDPDHPLLRDSLVPGYDFLLDEAGLASEWSNLDQSVSAIVDQSVSAIVDQSVSAIVDGDISVIDLDEMISPLLDQSVSAIVDSWGLPPSFGHGTMVAGLVRLVAPGARIMPLKVFNGDGQAHLFDILRAIYFAVDNGADVINMSFSMTEYDHELREAIKYARHQGVVVIAAAGNQGQHEAVYPAALQHAVGVASVTLDDMLSAFSNFGHNTVTMAAPGSAVISTYPGGLYAAGWGTSFSAPLVTGTAALFHRRSSCNNSNGTAVTKRVARDLKNGSDDLSHLGNLIGGGRLNVEGALWQAAGH